MSCSECWADIPRGAEKCVRCGAKFTGAELKVTGLFRAYPWLGPLLAGSFALTFWALTRRPPAPAEEYIPPAVEPVAAEEPAPAENAPSPEPPPFVFPPPEPAAAPAVQGPVRDSQELRQAENGAFSGPALTRPPGR